MLQVIDVSKRFGGLLALDSIQFGCSEGEILGIIGPNGAGKTTLFNCISGLYKPELGKILYKGKDIVGKSADVICHAGMARTFQVVRTFNNMTVLENAMVGALCRTSNVKTARQKALKIITDLGLGPKANMLGSSLTLANRKRCEIARALATEPKLLMLDEVMAGLNPSEINEAVEMIKQINRSGITLIVIEHVMEAVTSLAQRLIVLDFGKKLAEGTPEVIMKNEEVIKAYLGERYHARHSRVIC